MSNKIAEFNTSSELYDKGDRVTILRESNMGTWVYDNNNRIMLVPSADLTKIGYKYSQVGKALGKTNYANYLKGCAIEACSVEQDSKVLAYRLTQIAKRLGDL